MATKDIGNLRTRLSWEDEGATRSLEGLRRDLKGLSSEMNVARSRGREYSQSLKGMREQSDILTRRLKTQQERVQELKRRYDESVKAKGEDANQTKELASQYNNAVAQMNRTEEHLKRVNRQIEDQINPWKRLGRSMDETGKKMQEIGRSMTDFGKSYSLRVTAPIVAGGTAMFKAAMDYESAFAGVRKTVDMSEEGYKRLSDGIREMAKELPTAATDIAAVAESAGQLGIQNDAILGFTRTIIDLGEATNLTREQAATEFARFANIVGMAQDDFDRLGSSVVSLGNNMATTEAEIVSMGMRLAAQGSLVGMSEAQIMALAATMSSLGIEAEAGGTAMTTVLKRIETAVGEGGKSLNEFAKVAGVSSKEFADAWESDPIVALDMFIKGLSESGKEGENLSAILADLGIKGIRESDTILRLAGASDLLSEAVNISSKAWEENTALTDEAAQRYETTESQLKIMWNRIKDVGITLGEALVPAVMSAIDAAEPFIKQIESGAKAFSEMDESQQRTILKLIALVAAIGPASVALGGMTTTIGGLLKVGGSLSTMLGRAGGAAGGAGLLGRFALLGPGMATPVGLAIAGVTLLGTVAGIAAARKRDFRDVNLETVESLNEEVNALEANISRFEELQEKNKLSNDELARFVDITGEMQKTTDEKALEKLRQEYEQLLDKSGLTNDEMNEFVELNKNLAEKLDESNQKITENGEALVGNVDALKDLNEEQRERIRLELEAQKAAAEANMAENLAKQRDLQREINELNEKIPETKQRIADQEIYVGELAEKYRKAMEEGNIAQAGWLAKRIYDEGVTLQTLKDQLATQTNQNLEKQEQLDKVNQEIEKLDQVKQRMIELELSQVGINAKKGEELQAIDKEISKLENQKRQLDEKRQKQQINNTEYQNGVKKIDEQIANLRTARDRVEDITGEARETNRELGKDIDKDVTVDDNGTAKKVHDEASEPATKRVTLSAVWSGVQAGLRSALRNIRIPGFAQGTNYAPGGLALVGEEGFELAKLGNKWAMLDFGIANIPRGTQIFTHDESKKIIQALNRLPAYADGASFPGEADRVIRRLEQQNVPITGEAVIYTTVINQIDGRELSRHTYRHVTEFQETDKRRRERFAQ